MAARNCSTSSFRRGSPARLTTCTSAGKASASSNARAAEGTVLMSVGDGQFDCSVNSSASWTSTAQPPETRGTNSSKKDRSKQIDVEKRTWDVEARSKVCLAQVKKFTALECCNAVPLGGPVEPEV